MRSGSDFIVAVRGGLRVLLGHGDGTFDERFVPVPASVTSITVGHLNDDAAPDLIVGGFTVLGLLLGNGDATFELTALVNGPEWIATAEFDGDGLLDVVGVGLRSNDVAVYPGRGDGTVGPELRFAAGVEPRAIAAADLDDNGAPDLVVATGRGNTVTVLLNQSPVCPRDDDVPPSVTIFEWGGGITMPMSSIMASVLFDSHDDDGFEGDVVHERMLLDDCVILDGSTFGDEDGLLMDEELRLDSTTLCELAERCGFDALVEPTLAIEATDCAGNVGSGATRLTVSLALRPGVCP
jgi:hypothetical protein